MWLAVSHVTGYRDARHPKPNQYEPPQGSVARPAGPRNGPRPAQRGLLIYFRQSRPAGPGCAVTSISRSLHDADCIGLVRVSLFPGHIWPTEGDAMRARKLVLALTAPSFKFDRACLRAIAARTFRGGLHAPRSAVYLSIFVKVDPLAQGMAHAPRAALAFSSSSAGMAPIRWRSFAAVSFSSSLIPHQRRSVYLQARRYVLPQHPAFGGAHPAQFHRLHAQDERVFDPQVPDVARVRATQDAWKFVSIMRR
jgi:hypothetical protein